MRHKRKKAKTKRDRELEELKELQENNVLAMQQGKPKISWTPHDMKSITPINNPQTTMFKSFMNDYHIVADGSAGTGKTYAAIYLALNKLLNDKTKEKIIIVRSAVATRDIGFLPGDAEEKMAPFERPYVDMFDSMMKYSNSYNSMKEKGMVEFMPTSFIRGLNWDNAIVVVDEVQNLNFHEINSVLTRMGQNSRIILCGDYIQSDLNKSRNDSTGINKFLRVIQRMDSFDYVRFTPNDIIRSEFVKEWIVSVEEDITE